MALGAAALVGACSGDDDEIPRPSVTAPDDTGTTAATRVAPSELRTGVCVELGGFVPGTTVTVETVAPVPCELPHRGEVYGSLDHPAADDVDWPGDVEVAGYAESECLARFVPAIGAPYETSVFDFTVLAPTEDGWERGDRAIVCIAYGADGLPLTGTVLGAAR